MKKTVYQAIIICTLLFLTQIFNVHAQPVYGYLTDYNLGFNNIYIHASAHWMEPPSKEYFKPLLVWHDATNSAIKDSTFFDTFLLIQSAVKVGNYEYRLTQAGKNQLRSQLSHWIYYLDHFLFNENQYLGALNQAVNELELSENVKIIIPIPYPDHSQDNFNDLIDYPGNNLPLPCNFQNSESREAAIELYLSIVMEKWNKFENKNKLKLVGFYWLQEAKFQDWPNGIQDDTALLLKVSNLIRSFKLNEDDEQSYKFVMIPALPNAMGIANKPGMTHRDYQTTGLDAIILQPGLTYQFKTSAYVLKYVKKYANIDSVAIKCFKEGFGLSLEYHPPQELYEDKNPTMEGINSAVNIYISQLKAGFFYGFIEPGVMKSFWINPFTGQYGLTKLYEGVHTDLFSRRIQRILYDLTYYFIKGKYTPLLYNELENLLHKNNQ